MPCLFDHQRFHLFNMLWSINEYKCVNNYEFKF